MQILKDLHDTLGAEDVIIMICAKHLCISSRGIKDKNSFTTTIEYGGCFEDDSYRNKFINIVNNQKLDK